MKHLLIVEDGSEYTEFVRLWLADGFTARTARSAAAALTLLSTPPPVDALLIDLRFDRAPESELVGDVSATALRLFGGDRARALRYVQDQQGALILGELRARGYHQPALFIHDFPPRRLDNLRKLYGAVRAVPSFDAAEIRRVLDEPAGAAS